jgi:succinate dehydrogenase / fumarate reductase cytochrome b subunit
MAQANRPLSPHLQIYRWYLTMAMSIIHRATGIAITQSVLGNFFGGLILFGFTLALFLHGATGVRHLIWDLGYGIDKHTATRTSYWVLGAAVGLTLLTWLLVLIG